MTKDEADILIKDLWVRVTDGNMAYAKVMIRDLLLFHIEKAVAAQKVEDNDLLLRCYGVVEWILCEGMAPVEKSISDPDDLYLDVGRRLGTDKEYAELIK